MLQFLVVSKRLTIFLKEKNIGKRLKFLFYFNITKKQTKQTKIEPIIVTQKG